MDNAITGFLDGMRAIPREKNDLLDDASKALFDATSIGQGILRQQAIFFAHRNEPDHPDVIAHWAAQGAAKCLYPAGAGGTAGEFSVFTPCDLQPGEVLPVMYIMHGRNHPIHFAETYGFNSLVKDERFTAVYPSTFREPEVAMNELDCILKHLENEGLNIDRGRVYLFGFAAGSDGAVSLALACPEKFAALSPSPGGRCFYIPDYSPDHPGLMRMKALGMPLVCVSGTMDGDIFPKKDSSAGQLASLEAWLGVTGAAMQADLTPETTAALTGGDDPAARVLGIPFTDFETRRINGADWYIGRSAKADGAVTAMWARCKGLSHYMCQEGAKLVWDFMKNFRRGDDGHMLHCPGHR